MAVEHAEHDQIGRSSLPDKELLRRARTALKEEFQRSGNARSVLRKHRILIDKVLIQTWREFKVPAELALVAVGGYGRGELFPGSDVDILVLLPSPHWPGLAALLESLIGRLWDLGLEVGHSVRTLSECVEESAKDITVQTSLLEARLIAGSRSLFQKLCSVTKEGFDGPLFLSAKRLEQE